jgi:ATPase components of ABC transporters with duplicated ATPase domains
MAPRSASSAQRSGKSTLLRIIAGKEKSYNGEVVFSPGYSVGMLDQEPQLDDNKTVKQVVEEGVQEIVDILKEYEEINNKFAEPDADFDKLIARQGELTELIEQHDAWELDNKWSAPWTPSTVPMATHPCATSREANVAA